MNIKEITQYGNVMITVTAADLERFAQAVVSEYVRLHIPQKEERILTRKEVARMLCVSDRTVSNMMQRGVLHGIRVSGMVRFTLQEVEQYINTRGGRHD